MVRRLEEQQSLLKRREAVLAEIRQLRRKKIKHGNFIARWTRDRRELLHAAGSRPRNGSTPGAAARWKD